MSFINPLAIKVKNAEVEIRVQGQSTGLVLEVRPASDPRVKALDLEQRKEGVRVQKEGGDAVEHAMDHMEERLNDRVVAHVAGWRWMEGVEPALAALKYSEAQLREFLKAQPFGDAIRDAVFAAVGREEDFLEMPPPSSAQPSGTASDTACTGGTKSAARTARSK